MSKIETTYTPSSYESKWYNSWLEGGYFDAPVDESRTPFTLLMPPPNVTSQLHMGHGLGYTIQDILVRWNRMKGKNACWLPGTDHAGIATQMMLEKELAKDGITKQDLGREAFTDKLHAWKDKYGGLILEQFKSMGYSCDWNRLAYTLDPNLSESVRYVFVKLFEEGLIYRSERLVNWDTHLKTAVSDDEVESVELNGHLWFFRYPVDGTDEEIPIATTRPETMLGDTAVAVNPNDERFLHLIGKNVLLPFTNRLIPIVGDDYVKSEFGTGAVKITPAHDHNDFELGKRHNLPFISILEEDGTISNNCPAPFKGMDRFEARKLVIKELKSLGLFDEEKHYKHAVPHSERSKTVIEPKLSLQWYVNMKALAKPAADAARSGELEFFPPSYKKTYLYWLDNIQDWCISRQLWWGHRIPIWHCQDCNAATTGMTDPTQCSSCSSTNLMPDEDVLDTWFSSWLWPLSTFGWPDKESEKELDYFNPTDVLVTAPEIIFLWVARMVMVNLKFRNKLPFKKIYFNATVCDKKGKKFSKTLGNGIDPLDVIKEHGADAVRYTAVSLAPLGGRVKMAREDFEIGARFINKVWNASRFLMQNIDENQAIIPLDQSSLQMPEIWLLERFKQTAHDINESLENYRINDAVDLMYQFFWGSFCDWGLEAAKESLSCDDSKIKDSTVSALLYVLNGCLRLAHPVMPFVTEELWHKLPKHPDWDSPTSLCIATFPTSEKRKLSEEALSWSRAQDLVSKIRSVRQQSGIPPKDKLRIFIECKEKQVEKGFTESSQWLKRLANLNTIEFDLSSKPASCLSATGSGFNLYIPVAGLLDIEKELKRLTSERDRLQKVFNGLDKKMSNQNFVARAPDDVIKQTKDQLANIKEQLESIIINIDSLKGE